MKKLLGVLLVGALLMFGGCGDDKEDIEKVKVEAMLGEWDLTIKTSATTTASRELMFTEIVKTEDGVWGAASEGTNYIDVCVFDKEENSCGALTIYFNEYTQEATGDMEMFLFGDTADTDNIIGICNFYDYSTDTTTNDYNFNGIRTSTLGNAKKMKSVKKRVNDNGVKREVTSKERELMKNVLEIANKIKNK